jgi:hypothetical protein
MSERGQQGSGPNRRVREQVEQDRGVGRDLPPSREPDEAPPRPTSPVGDPDPTEWPDPYDRRPDPRDPATVDTPADPADPEAEEAADPAPGIRRPAIPIRRRAMSARGATSHQSARPLRR